MTFVRTLSPILMADDDLDDCEMAWEALQESRIANPLEFVHDGQELLDYLHHRRDGYRDAKLPALILLDLKMPRKDGLQALREIKADPDLRHLPVVVLTTSKEEEDICQSYDLGASTFITKPATSDGLLEVMRTLGEYWFGIAHLPNWKAQPARSE